MFSLLVLRRGVSLQEVQGNQETGIKPILCEDSLGQFSQTNRSCVCVNKWNFFLSLLYFLNFEHDKNDLEEANNHLCLYEVQLGQK